MVLSPVNLRSASQRIFGTPRGRLLYLAVASTALALFLYEVGTVYVRPNEFALKQVTVGRNKGIRPEVLGPGLHWVVPGTERLHRFPSDLQLLSLTDNKSERQREDSRVTPALNIQTSEGYNVTVDIAVLYRVEEPFKVMGTVGPGRLFEDSLVIPRAEQILRKRLGELDAEQFYDVKLRGEKSKLALEELNAELIPGGVRATAVFVRRFIYDERYQHAIEQRKIQDQTVFKNKAEGEMATANAEKDRIVAVGEAAVKVELSRGDAEKLKLKAAADLYERKQQAAGQLQTQLAEAEGTRLENEALRGVGSERMVGLKMADVLKGTRVVVIPTDGEGGFNPLDLGSVLKKFDVKE